MKFSRSKAQMFSVLSLLSKIKDNDTLPEKAKYKVMMAYNYIDQSMDDIQEFVELELKGILNGDDTNKILNTYVKDGHDKNC